jgi:PhnB protein
MAWHFLAGWLAGRPACYKDLHVGQICPTLLSVKGAEFVRASPETGKTEVGGGHRRPHPERRPDPLGENMASTVKGVPDNSSVVIPRLVCRDPASAIDFCASTFDAIELVRRPGPDGTVAHALMTIGPAMIMIEAEWPTLPSRAPTPDGTSPVVIFVYVEDVDQTVERAVGLGAQVLIPAQNQFWGDRIAWIMDQETSARALEKGPVAWGRTGMAVATPQGASRGQGTTGTEATGIAWHFLGWAGRAGPQGLACRTNLSDTPRREGSGIRPASPETGKAEGGRRRVPSRAGQRQSWDALFWYPLHSVRDLKDELKTGTLHAMLKQLSLRLEDLEE